MHLTFDSEAATSTAISTTEQKPSDILKVSAQSRAGAVAGAIVSSVHCRARAEIHAIGPGAVNQAIKAVAIARPYLLLAGFEITFVPERIGVIIDDAECTVIRIVVEARPLAHLR
ncbi:MAG: stage V sporulation protein S [Chloroflexi bacterium]|nr:stage V sporulation protein S [Chloroflexota bacterium]